MSSVVSLVALTMWTTGGGTGISECVVNKDVMEPFRTIQGRLNAGMFVPFGLFGVMATRRPAVTLGLGLLLSAGIETMQGTVSLVGRLCDTSDLVANSAGVVVGVLIGAALNGLGKDQQPLSGRSTRGAMVAVGLGAVVLGGAWGLFVSPRVVERTVSDIGASQAQEEAIASAVRHTFGNEYAVGSVQFTPGEDGQAGTIMASLARTGSGGDGVAELKWPGKEEFNVNLIPSRVEEGHGYSVDGIPARADKKEDAERMATKYAERHASWGLDNSEITVEPVDQDQDSGWMVSWRRWNGKVLLPMRLDVLIEPSGKLTDLMTRNIPDPELPPVKRSEKEAWNSLEEHFSLKGEKFERMEPALLAQQRDGSWRVNWLLALKTEKTYYSATVDATTGRMYTPEERPVNSVDG
ncbi:VanZ family protein [Streptomyces sp. NBC_00872]|uniref:VanZ family protein n=1 Tax=Streptomyces sp. NBC_00872 TaxID=2903686 RepID=UPI00386FAA4A|nr:VanZ family protein [Streptomyces sp. NBC_00872]